MFLSNGIFDGSAVSKDIRDPTSSRATGVVTESAKGSGSDLINGKKWWSCFFFLVHPVCIIIIIFIYYIYIKYKDVEKKDSGRNVDRF